jgi:hypothetical protein
LLIGAQFVSFLLIEELNRPRLHPLQSTVALEMLVHHGSAMFEMVAVQKDKVAGHIPLDTERIL